MTFLPIFCFSVLNLNEICIQWMILLQSLMQNNISGQLAESEVTHLLPVM